MRIPGAAQTSERRGPTQFHPSDNALGKAEAPRALASAYLWISIVGVCGFVGLLVASHYWAPLAAPLRVAALVWFLGFGVLRGLLIGRRQRSTL
jgi:hypothetical protein